MPRITLNIDEETLTALEDAAAEKHLSAGEYATEILRRSVIALWPDHYDELYGSIRDESFIR